MRQIPKKRKGWKRGKFIEVHYHYTTHYDGGRALAGPKGSEDVLIEDSGAKAPDDHQDA